MQVRILVDIKPDPWWANERSAGSNPVSNIPPTHPTFSANTQYKDVNRRTMVIPQLLSLITVYRQFLNKPKILLKEKYYLKL